MSPTTPTRPPTRPLTPGPALPPLAVAPVVVRLSPTLQPAFARLQARGPRWLKRGCLLLGVGLVVLTGSGLWGAGTFHAPPDGLSHADVPASVAEGLNDPEQLHKLRDYVERGVLEANTLRQADDAPLTSGAVEYLRAQSAYQALARGDLTTREREQLRQTLRTLVDRLLPKVAAAPEAYDARTLYVLEHAVSDTVRSAPALTIAASVQAERAQARHWARVGYGVGGLLVALALALLALGAAVAARVTRITAAIEEGR